METPKLPVAEVLRVVWRVYRRRWRFLVPLSLVVLLPQGVADAVLTDLSVDSIRNLEDLLKASSIPIAIAINLGGEALYAGIVAAAVVEWLEGRELRDVPGAIRSIAFVSLIALDLILAIGTTVGLVLLLVPGVLFYTYMAVSPALIELNGLRVAEAMRQSRELVRGNFWRVLLFTIVVLLVAEGVTTALESPLHGLHGELIFNLAIEAAVEPFQGLTTVFLALALLDLHGHDPRLSAFVEAEAQAGRGEGSTGERSANGADR